MDKERLQSQEDQADLRAEVTLAGQRSEKLMATKLSQQVIRPFNEKNIRKKRAQK